MSVKLTSGTILTAPLVTENDNQTYMYVAGSGINLNGKAPFVWDDDHMSFYAIDNNQVLQKFSDLQSALNTVANTGFGTYGKVVFTSRTYPIEAAIQIPNNVDLIADNLSIGGSIEFLGTSNTFIGTRIGSVYATSTTNAITVSGTYASGVNNLFFSCNQVIVDEGNALVSTGTNVSIYASLPTAVSSKISVGSNALYLRELSQQLYGLNPVAGSVSSSDSVISAMNKILGNQANFVLKTTTVNGQALSSNVTLNAVDVGATGLAGTPTVGNIPVFQATDGTLQSSSVLISDLEGLTGNVQNQIDNLNSGIAIKEAKAVSLINIDGGNPGTDTFDGVTINSGDYLLLTAQNTVANNGIYIFNGASSPVARAPTMNTWEDVVGSQVMVPPSTTYASGSVWRSTVPSSGTLGTTAITFQVMPSGSYVAGTGITISSNTISADVGTTTGKIVQLGATGLPAVVSNNTLVSNPVTSTQTSLSVALADLNNQTPSGDIPFYVIDGTNTTLAGAIASGKGEIVLEASNTDTGAKVSLTRDTTIECLDGSILSFNRIDKGDFNLTFRNVDAVLDGVNNVDGNYGIFSITGGGYFYCDNSTIDNSASDITSNSINSTDCYFSSVNSTFISGSAPTTGILWNGEHLNAEIEVLNPTSISVLKEPPAQSNIKKVFNGQITANGFAGGISGTFNVGASFPTSNLNLTISGVFPNYSAVKVVGAGAGDILPGGMSSSSTYFVINVSSNRIQLADSYENAKSATPISITSAGTGSFIIMQAQSLIYSFSASCSTDISYMLSGGTNAKNIAYIRVGGTNKTQLLNGGTSLVIEYTNNGLTNQLRLNSYYSGNFGEEGRIITNFSSDYNAQFIVENFSGGSYSNYQDPTSDNWYWTPVLKNGRLEGDLSIVGFGNSPQLYQRPIISNVTCQGDILVDTTQYLTVDNSRAMNWNLGLLTYSEFNNIISEVSFNTTSYAQMSFNNCTLNGSVSAHTSSLPANLSMCLTKGDATFSRTASGASFFFHGAANFSQFV